MASRQQTRFQLVYRLHGISKTPAPGPAITWEGGDTEPSSHHGFGEGYLQGDVRVQLEGRHFICPRQEFLCFGVNVVVKNGPLRG